MEHIFKSGTYYIGDLCYVVKGEEWDGLVNTWLDDSCLQEVMYLEDYKGGAIYCDGTHYGDGVYHDDYGNTYPVDSGSIGIISVEHPIVDSGKLERIGNLGVIETFLKDFKVSSENGVFNFVHITIDTKGAKS